MRLRLAAVRPGRMGRGMRLRLLAGHLVLSCFSLTGCASGSYPAPSAPSFFSTHVPASISFGLHLVRLGFMLPVHSLRASFQLMLTPSFGPGSIDFVGTFNVIFLGSGGSWLLGDGEGDGFGLLGLGFLLYSVGGLWLGVVYLIGFVGRFAGCGERWGL